MLAALRANKGWPRVIALVLLLAFSVGLLHVHAADAFAGSAAGVSDAHDGDGHGHDGLPASSVTSHCAFCAVVAGKFYLSGDTPDLSVVDGGRITFPFAPSQLTSTQPTDLFRPPIASLG